LIGEITVEELAKWRDDGRDFTLLDVREPDEVQIASIEGAQWIPMRDIPARVSELPKEHPIAVFCHHGGRSERVARYLAMQGFAEVLNVDGGIDAYAQRVDNNIPRY
jgi:sulfur-carrier protein adenylyltransferase/sulfurtransferase